MSQNLEIQLNGVSATEDTTTTPGTTIFGLEITDVDKQCIYDVDGNLIGITDVDGVDHMIDLSAGGATFVDNGNGQGTITDPNNDTCAVSLAIPTKKDGSAFAKGETFVVAAPVIRDLCDTAALSAEGYDVSGISFADPANPTDQEIAAAVAAFAAANPSACIDFKCVAAHRQELVGSAKGGGFYLDLADCCIGHADIAAVLSGANWIMTTPNDAGSPDHHVEMMVKSDVSCSDPAFDLSASSVLEGDQPYDGTLSFPLAIGDTGLTDGCFACHIVGPPDANGLPDMSDPTTSVSETKYVEKQIIWAIDSTPVDVSQLSAGDSSILVDSSDNAATGGTVNANGYAANAFTDPLDPSSFDGCPNDTFTFLQKADGTGCYAGWIDADEPDPADIPINVCTTQTAHNEDYSLTHILGDNTSVREAIIEAGFCRIKIERIARGTDHFLVFDPAIGQFLVFGLNQPTTTPAGFAEHWIHYRLTSVDADGNPDGKPFCFTPRDVDSDAGIGVHEFYASPDATLVNLGSGLQPSDASVVHPAPPAAWQQYTGPLPFEPEPNIPFNQDPDPKALRWKVNGSAEFWTGRVFTGDSPTVTTAQKWTFQSCCDGKCLNVNPVIG